MSLTPGAPPTPDPVEARRVNLAQDGDEDAFAGLVRSHQDRLYAIALRMTGNAHDAQDAVQEALVQAWKALPRFHGESTFGTWVTRIVINRCTDLHRRTRPVDQLPDDGENTPDALQEAPADTIAVAEHRRQAVRRALLQLPTSQRAPLVLTTFGGHTHAEAARILGISESATKVRTHRARRTLATLMQEWR